MLPPAYATVQLSEVIKNPDHLQCMLDNKLYDIIIVISAISYSVGYMVRMSKHYH